MQIAWPSSAACSSMPERRTGAGPAPDIFDLVGKRIWVTGHRGMVGSAILRRLRRESCVVLTAGRERADLRVRDAVDRAMDDLRPDIVIVAAATVGGIVANDTRPAEFLFDNLAIQTNLIDSAAKAGVPRLLFLGSSCIYPKDAAQPISEDALLTGPLEPTNQWYAIAKIAGIKLCEAYRRQYGCSFISAMPCNLYGPNDNFDVESAHVIPGLLHKTYVALRDGKPALDVWGSGKPLREFLHVDDLADAVVHLLKCYDAEETINVGTGSEIEIGRLAELICDIAGYDGALRFDASRPDGTFRKRLDTAKLAALGWTPSIGLREGLTDTWHWYVEKLAEPELPAANHA